MPELTEEQKSELPKNVITRALGMQEHVSVDLQGDDAMIGDCYVLCSDGLSGMIEDQEILEIVQHSSTIDEACRKLIAVANEHGGEDNITAVLVKVEAEPGAEKVSLSDTLPTPVTITAPLPPAAVATDVNADTPPAGETKPK
jgi:protein phosphatase